MVRSPGDTTGDGGIDREYPYRGKAPVFVLLIVWGLALGSLYWAATDVGPIRGRDGLVTVAEAPARFIRWSVFGLCALLAVHASRWVWIDRVHPRRLAFSDHGIYFPRVRWCWFSVEQLMRYEGITSFSLTVVKRVGFRDGVPTRFHFVYAGRRFSINRDNLPDGAFDEVCALLAERVASARRA